MEIIERYVEQKDYKNAVEECIKQKLYYLGLYIVTITKQDLTNLKKKKTIRIKLYCNWCSCEQLFTLWKKMSQGDGVWGNIEIVLDGTADYYVIINGTSEISFDKKKTIIFTMEPNMEKNPNIWGEWSDPKGFLKVFNHKDTYNNLEWHLSKTYQELITTKPEKKYDVLSTVLSDKYNDPGHVKRVDFIKYLEKKMDVHVYGNDRWKYKNYKGELPYHCKDDAIFPYKYVFNCENHECKNYFTEKLIDGILGECLVFYSGCFNVKQYIDEKAFVQLDLTDFENDHKIICKAIKEDWYTQRLPYILEAKKKILNELQFFPRLEKFISTL